MNPYVVPLGGGDPQLKADYIEKEILKGKYDPIYFMDDQPKNISAVNKLKKKYPDVKLVTKLVKWKLILTDKKWYLYLVNQ